MSLRSPVNLSSLVIQQKRTQLFEKLYRNYSDKFVEFIIDFDNDEWTPDDVAKKFEKRKAQGLELLPTKDLLKMMREKMELLSIKKGYLSRNMNEGFSGGEKKRNEIFQMAMLEPKLAILDETDSGLDIDALRIVANGVNKLRTGDNATIVITHYQRLLDYIIPDFVHVLHNGRIIKSGGKELALELEEKGYDWITKEADKKWA